MRMYSPWYRGFRGAREREGEKGGGRVSPPHVGKREITVERREECDSTSIVARIEMVPCIVSLLRAQYSSTSRATYPRSCYRSLPLPAGTSSVMYPTNRQ